MQQYDTAKVPNHWFLPSAGIPTLHPNSHAEKTRWSLEDPPIGIPCLWTAWWAPVVVRACRCSQSRWSTADTSPGECASLEHRLQHGNPCYKISLAAVKHAFGCICHIEYRNIITMYGHGWLRMKHMSEVNLVAGCLARTFSRMLTKDVWSCFGRCEALNKDRNAKYKFSPPSTLTHKMTRMFGKQQIKNESRSFTIPLPLSLAIMFPGSFCKHVRHATKFTVRLLIRAPCLISCNPWSMMVTASRAWSGAEFSTWNSCAHTTCITCDGTFMVHYHLYSIICYQVLLTSPFHTIPLYHCANARLTARGGAHFGRCEVVAAVGVHEP